MIAVLSFPKKCSLNNRSPADLPPLHVLLKHAQNLSILVLNIQKNLQYGSKLSNVPFDRTFQGRAESKDYANMPLAPDKQSATKKDRLPV